MDFAIPNNTIWTSFIRTRVGYEKEICSFLKKRAEKQGLSTLGDPYYKVLGPFDIAEFLPFNTKTDWLYTPTHASIYETHSVLTLNLSFEKEHKFDFFRWQSDANRLFITMASLHPFLFQSIRTCQA